MRLTHIDLFSGIGGFALAARWAGFHTVCFVEIDEYCQKVLQKNFGAVAHDSGVVGRTGQKSNGQGFEITNSSQSRLYADIRSFDATPYRGATLLTGGFPCQPFSQAGKRRGKEDDRALWPEMFRVIQEARPAWCLCENVTGLVTMELDSCISDLEGAGYAVQSFIIPACAVDARHRRDRVWIVGNSNEQGSQGYRELRKRGSKWIVRASGEDVADTTDNRCERPQWAIPQNGHAPRRLDVSDRCERFSQSSVRRMASRLPRGLDGHYEYEPEWEGVPRVATGVKNRVQRLKGLGNSVQPQVAYEILKAIAKIAK